VETNQSLPSGHTLASVAVLGVLALVLIPGCAEPRTRLVAIAAAAAAMSRLYQGRALGQRRRRRWLIGAMWGQAGTENHTVLTDRTHLRSER